MEKKRARSQSNAGKRFETRQLHSEYVRNHCWYVTYFKNRESFWVPWTMIATADIQRLSMIKNSCRRKKATRHSAMSCNRKRPSRKCLASLKYRTTTGLGMLNSSNGNHNFSLVFVHFLEKVDNLRCLKHLNSGIWVNQVRHLKTSSLRHHCISVCRTTTCRDHDVWQHQ